MPAGKLIKYNDGAVRSTKSKKVPKSKRVTGLSKKQVRAVRSIAKQVAMDIPEAKHFDLDLTGLNIGSSSSGTPVVQSLCNISQGDTENTRDGNHIRPLYQGGRYTITGVHAAGQLVTRVRVQVVRFKSNTAQSGEPNHGTLLQNQARPFIYLQSNQTMQYEVLYDARHYIVNSKENEAFTVYGEFNLGKLKQVSFNDANTQGEGKIYFMAISNYTNVDNAYPTVTLDARMRYLE